MLLSFVEAELQILKILRKNNIFQDTAVIQIFITLLVFIVEHLLICHFEAHEYFYNFILYTLLL